MALVLHALRQRGARRRVGAVLREEGVEDVGVFAHHGRTNTKFARAPKLLRFFHIAEEGETSADEVAVEGIVLAGRQL